MAARQIALTAYFLKLGAVGFGGPAALAARMQRDLVEARGWLGADEYLEGLAFAQLAPGPLAAQLAMYLGYVNGGIAGATVAGAAFILPSFAMVVALAVFYVRVGQTSWVQVAFYGVAPAVVGLIAVASGRLARRIIKHDPWLAAIFSIVAVWTAVSEREVVALFIASGVLMIAVRRRFLGIPGTACVAAVIVWPSAALLDTLFVFFAKAGFFVFGSGLAIVPFLYAGVVHDHHWLTDQQFVDAVAVAMITPGPVVIAVAFIGYVVAGLNGAFAAAAGIFAPVYFMVIVFAPIFRRHAHNERLKAFVAGVTAAAAGAIAGASLVIARRTVHDRAGIAIAAIAVLLLVRWKVPEPLVVVAGALAGGAVQLLPF